MGFQKLKKQNRLYLQCCAFCETGLVRHAFTTRLGGASHGKIEGLNLGFRVDDSPSAVQQNYRYLAQDLDLPYDSMVLSRQTHTNHVRCVTSEDAGKGLTQESDIFDTDGLITNLPDIPLVIFTADCVPILLLDKRQRAIGAIHAGWRGTVRQIAAEAVQLMHRSYGSKPDDILAAIGPSIGPCCFEADWDTAQQFHSALAVEQSNGKFLINLWEANRLQLMECGVLPEHIFTAEECTKCNPDIYYSYRAQKERTGRMAAVISLKNTR